MKLPPVVEILQRVFELLPTGTGIQARMSVVAEVVTHRKFRLRKRKIEY